jgi:hypothetical protein
MRILITASVLLALSGVVQASEPPTCYAGEPNAAEADPLLYRTADGCIISWHCAVNHKWETASIVLTTNECRLATVDRLDELQALSHAARDALWRATFTAPVDPASTDAHLLALAADKPRPAIPTQDGLVTQSPLAYKLRLGIGTFTVLEVGKVGLQQPCKGNVAVSDSTGTYYALTTKVTMNAPSAPLPPILYGHCSP